MYKTKKQDEGDKKSSQMGKRKQTRRKREYNSEQIPAQESETAAPTEDHQEGYVETEA